MYYKIIYNEDENGEITEEKVYYTAPPLDIGGFSVYNPTAEQIEAEGYVWEDTEENLENIAPTLEDINERVDILENAFIEMAGDVYG